ncbi:extracellular solute-binding protein [Nonomuraea sp. H19]|uniref:extracellular solute-binding protein n=1 Tax=Nonomuraea sp. H19 TaxID=3452206 RepID=UPI003F8A03E0
MSVPPSNAFGRRRFLTASAGAAFAATTLSSCAASVNSGGGGSGSGKTTTLTVMTVADEWDKPTVQAIEKLLNVKLSIVLYDTAKLNAMLASKNPPDLVRSIGAVDTPYFAARGVMTDLDPYFAQSKVLKDSDIDPVNDVWRFDGKKQGAGPRYGLAKDYSQDSMLWYRTDMFDAANLDHPSDTEPLSYDEVLDLGNRLVKRRLGKVKVYGLNVTGMGFFAQFMQMTASAGGRLFAEDLASVDFSSPEALKALQWYIEYAKANIGPSVTNPNPDGWDGPTYQADRVAMCADGYWFGGLIGEEPKLAEVSRFAPAPQLGSHRVSPCFGATGFWMPKDAKNKEVAWKFFEWYFGGQAAQDRASGGWGIPGLKSLHSKMPQDTPFHKQAFEVQQRELPYFSVLPFTPYVQLAALDGAINKVLPNAIKSGAAAGKIADELNSRMNEQISKGKELVG